MGAEPARVPPPKDRPESGSVLHEPADHQLQIAAHPDPIHPFGQEARPPLTRHAIWFVDSPLAVLAGFLKLPVVEAVASRANAMANRRIDSPSWFSRVPQGSTLPAQGEENGPHAY